MLGQFPAAKDTEVCKFVYTYVYGLLYNAHKLYCYYIADYIMYVCIYLGLLRLYNVHGLLHGAYWTSTELTISDVKMAGRSPVN